MRRVAWRTSRIADESAWVVCLGRLREVRAGAVRCPVARRGVAVTRCRDCHRLADAWDERDRVESCATAPGLS